jgi:trehalose-phosphatase
VNASLRDRMTPPSALACWDEIVRRAAGARLALFLDYDGTLAPIAPTPELATLPAATREALARVAARFPVAILSGRGREDVAAQVGLPDLIYAGSHGFDIAAGGAGNGAGPGFHHEVGPEIPQEIAAAAARLESALGEIPGVRIEPKRFALSVHYRLAPEERLPEIERAVDAALAAHPALRKGFGKKLFELRPNLDWDKGRALLWILERLGLEGSGEGSKVLPIYVGDDWTDEDAFRALSNLGGMGGIGIVVAEAAEAPRETAADYSLCDPGEVRELLDRLAALPAPVESAASPRSEERLRRQNRVLAELARRKSAPGELPAAFAAIIERAALTLEVERVSIWLFDAERTKISCLDLYERTPGRHSQGLELTAASYPAYFAALESERIIAAHDAGTDPRTREFLDNYLLPLGITAMLDAPVLLGGRLAGVVCHEEVGTPRHWTPDEQSFAGAIADLCAIAIEEDERDALLKRERQARAEAEEANRIKDEFLATVSHELRTPLNAIMSWVHLLRARTPDPATLERALATIDRNVSAQVQIIDDILDVSRMIRGSLALEMEPVDLGLLAGQAIESLRPAAEAKGVAVETRLGTGVASASVVLGDPDRLRQVIWNLLSNAVKFTPRGGRVEIALEEGKGEVCIVVADNGSGIAPEFLPHVFERFRQADGSTTRMHGGLGLGLAIVRHLVELHGGTVTAESPGKGQGSRLTVLLPASLAAAAPDAFSGPGDGR